MPAYAFETITAEQALAFSSADSITFAVSAKNTSVLFNADGTFTVVTAARSVVFGAEFQSLGGSRITFSDGSLLYLGTANADTRDYSNVIPSTGAMYAGAGDDTLTGSVGGWLIQGNQGDDRIVYREGAANTIYGGQDNDSITSVAVGGDTTKSQFAQGNKGNDNIQGASGTDTLLGGQGDDRVFGAGGNDFINGNLGNDILSGGGRLFGEGGDDDIATDGRFDSTVSGGDGNDFITVGAMTGVATRNSVTGDVGNDTINASSDTIDELSGGEGDDRISITQNLGSGALNNGKLIDGGDGADTLIARGGDDTLRGGEGADSLQGGAGTNRIEGGGGNDFADSRTQTGVNVFDGGEGADTLLGGQGVDTVSGGAGNDNVGDFGGVGNLVDAGSGDDRISIVAGSSTVLAGDGADTVDAILAGAQSISGGTGNDSMRGAGGADTIAGEVGDDTLDTGGGADIMTGGVGSDRFQLLNGGGAQAGKIAQVSDWSSEDRIEFKANFTTPALYIESTASDFASAVGIAQTQLNQNDNVIVSVQVGADVIVFSGRTVGSQIDTAIVLVGRSLSDISDSNFV